MTVRKEIWLLVDSRGSGGIESHILQLASGLNQHHFPVSVVFIADYGSHPLKDALTEHGIRVITLSHAISGLWRLVKKEKPRLLHSHGYKAGIISRFIGMLRGIPVVSTYHAGEAVTGKLAVYDFIDRHTAMLAAQCLTVSQPISQRLPVASLMLNNFVHTESVSMGSGEKYAFVGRLSEEKGPHIMLDIARKLPDIQFHIYGDGPLSAQLQQQASVNVTFHGAQPDMSKIWPEIGLLIMPSLFEGLPMAALESMSRGIPVVATHVGALPDLINNGVNGWLLPEADSDDFIDYIQQWQLMPVDQQMHMRLHARYQVATKFSADTVIPQLISIYQKVSC
ncbi:glycosyltransferase family 4 protein [Photobacterium nomapromontoriensis]|uniref:glycosyltransferase family 4 protein n=1 Tax=Photobacterium nomapromontoriensis TaxID=2910237 RepID=UPI003D0D7136